MTDQLHIVPTTANRRAELEAIAHRYYAEVLPDGPPFVGRTLDPYWTIRGRHPYLIEHGGKVIGFALVWTHTDGLHELTEITIDSDHRDKGLGTEAAHRIFSSLSGDWTLGVSTEPPGAMAFWLKCLHSFDDAHDIIPGPPKTPDQTGSVIPVLSAGTVMAFKDTRHLVKAREPFIVPKGFTHRPHADTECPIFPIESKGEPNTAPPAAAVPMPRT